MLPADTVNELHYLSDRVGITMDQIVNLILLIDLRKRERKQNDARSKSGNKKSNARVSGKQRLAKRK